jgi:hypothetical protein
LLNVVFALMLTTSILGPVLTGRLTPRMLEAEEAEKIPWGAARMRRGGRLSKNGGGSSPSFWRAGRRRIIIP